MSDNDLRASADEGAERGARIRAARDHVGLSQEGLADALTERMGHRVRQTHISRWERGSNKPSDRYAIELAAVLGVNAGWLLLGAASGAPAPKWWKEPERKDPAPPIAPYAHKPERAKRPEEKGKGAKGKRAS